MPLAAIPCHERLRLAAQRTAQRLRHVAVGLKAALADGGADGRPDVRRGAAVCLTHGADGLAGDPGGGAAPTGVGGAHHMAHRVVEQDHVAVGGEHHQRDTGNSGDEGVGTVIILRTPQTLAAVCCRHHAHIVPVNLTAQHDAADIHVQRGAQAAEVLLHIGMVVAPPVIQIQAVPRRGGHAAQTGGKAVDDAAVRQCIGGAERDAVFNLRVEHSGSFRKQRRAAADAAARRSVEAI